MKKYAVILSTLGLLLAVPAARAQSDCADCVASGSQEVADDSQGDVEASDASVVESQEAASQDE